MLWLLQFFFLSLQVHQLFSPSKLFIELHKTDKKQDSNLQQTIESEAKMILQESLVYALIKDFSA